LGNKDNKMSHKGGWGAGGGWKSAKKVSRISRMAVLPLFANHF